MSRKPILVLISLCLFIACARKDKPGEETLFAVLDSRKTGLDFANKLHSSDSFNLFKYMYFYNGAGVGAGDFNNDGYTDLFFASNQGKNALYLNQRGLKFRNVTEEAKVPNDGGWSTGVSVVDINNDGLLDIYVCRVGKFMMLDSRNQFLICTGIENGIPQYEDRAAALGVDFSGFGTQAAFLDYDLDGDLDLFLLNHSVHHNSNFRERKSFAGTFHPESGSRLYRNDGERFTDVTQSCGINSTAISYGLGIVVTDFNFDGYPDLYIGNDFHENDYLYINQGNGTFKDVATEQTMHTSQYTMGVDAADVTNDGLPEVISVDMLPSDPYILKRSLGEDAYDIFFLKINYGYHYQYTRNNLQYNRGDHLFSETGLYSGVAATDWSWAPLWLDFDNDGWKDLFISNGIPKRMNDIDYINYVSAEEIQQKINLNRLGEKDEVLIQKFPQIKIPNKFFRNNGNLEFRDIEKLIADDVPTYSNGAIYADFDNDGDLDIVVNNIDDNVVLYKNLLNDAGHRPYLLVKLIGTPSNINALGAKVIVFAGNEVRAYEKNSVRGFLSSSETPLHIGLGSTKIDSIVVVWPDNTYQRLSYNINEPRPLVRYKSGLPRFDYEVITRKSPQTRPFKDISAEVNINHVHRENKFPEFDREPLMPHMVSTEGPALAVADINGDRLDDVFIGSSKGFRSVVYLQQADGRFVRTEQPELAQDSMYEDVDACWVDVNNDKIPDLVVASGGNEYYGRDRHLLPRVYINDGTGRLRRRVDAIEGVYHTSSCVVPYDFNGDGFVDLFVGGRVMPWEYGKVPPSYLLQNDGTGRFTDVTAKYSPELGKAGFVTKAVWVDVNRDDKKDLVICSQWGTIDAYINRNGRFTKATICNKKGWWNTIVPCDIDGDGNVDFIAGNLGWNSRLKASEEQPVRLYYNDFDDNGKKEQLLTYYVRNREILFANKSEIERQMPVMRKKFLYAKDFASADLKDIIGKDKLASAEIFAADYFASSLLISRGGTNYEVVPLPWQAQLSPVRDAVVLDANADGLSDILLLGNYYANNVEMGRYDADYGSLLLNDGGGNLHYEKLEGTTLKGEARNARRLLIQGREAFVVARNNDSTVVLSIQH